LSSSSNDVGRWNIFRCAIKFYWTKNIFVKSFFRNHHRVMSHVMDWDVHRTCQHANMCILWFSTGCAKSAHFGGGVEMVVFGGYPKKGHFGPPRGARNFLHPPPGKPRQNIYYLDTRHPPGGGPPGGGFQTPPGPSGRVCVLVPFLHPPAGVQKLESWHHRCHDQPMEHTWCVKSFHVRSDACSSSWHENIFCVLRKYFTHSSHRRSRRFDESANYFFIHMKNIILKIELQSQKPRYWVSSWPFDCFVKTSITGGVSE
jgi:hypothetical protein